MLSSVLLLLSTLTKNEDVIDKQMATHGFEYISGWEVDTDGVCMERTSSHTGFPQDIVLANRLVADVVEVDGELKLSVIIIQEACLQK